jgi:hypothetical protein
MFIGEINYVFGKSMHTADLYDVSLLLLFLEQLRHAIRISSEGEPTSGNPEA